jgi:hypothetical protein
MQYACSGPMDVPQMRQTLSGLGAGTGVYSALD